MKKSIIAGLFLLLASSRGFSADSPSLSLGLSSAKVCSGVSVTATASIGNPPPYVTGIGVSFTDEENNDLGSGTADSDNSWTVTCNVSFTSGLHTITASSSDPELSDDADGEWVYILLDPTSSSVAIRCDGAWPLFTNFGLDDDSYAPDPVTWSIAEDGGPATPSPNASIPDNTVGAINVGDVPGAYIVTATDGTCSGTATLTTGFDCTRDHHTMDTTNPADSLPGGDCPRGHVGTEVFGTSLDACGMSLQVQCGNFVYYDVVGGDLIGRCPYWGSTWGAYYRKCKCRGLNKWAEWRVTELCEGCGGDPNQRCANALCTSCFTCTGPGNGKGHRAFWNDYSGTGIRTCFQNDDLSDTRTCTGAD